MPVDFFFEGLAEGSPMKSRANGCSSADLSVLDSAFLAIEDGETRESVIALVRSLGAGTEMARNERRQQQAN